MTASHSSGLRLEVNTVEALWWRATQAVGQLMGRCGEAAHPKATPRSTGRKSRRTGVA
jgi:hypothetical protein